MEMEGVKLPVVEIFNSISGEGISAGEIVTFVRVAGCNLRCDYCDTMYSYQDEEYELLTPQQIVNRINNFGTQQVICTGGEPLEEDKPKRYLPLYLAKQGFEVRIETNGSWSVYNQQELQKFGLDGEGINYTLDIKCPSSNMAEYNLFTNLEQLGLNDEIKFVVQDKSDIDYALKVIDDYKNELSKQEIVINFSPVFEELAPKKLVSILQEHQTYFAQFNLKVRLSIQLHKLIWDPEVTGV
ncbi:7-carboxy-7-deazaguanine synthase QueE [Acetohalobium arabaticum]|uniref:7-carboxy-7-deazaguanine synthase n=1 Tax=Acetohalobium arabaticum (strain ATCC 49924 / DSM 5501 / Z-7288) TaxID=574087 RepID=D9QQX8_ACEAZ|nr:radical SAM protein [Acetohalobium arabaticum]ADL12919.1 Radical SAM domain protein [Acetohalobium arabaticum DSM 5501]